MKYVKQVLLILVLISNILTLTLTRRSHMTKSRMHQYHRRDLARFYVHFARLAYCDPNEVLGGTCALCPGIRRLGSKIAYVHSERRNGIRYTMAISTHFETGELVVSFGGPKSSEAAYFQQIYTNGLVSVPELRNARVEPEFWRIYSQVFRQALIEAFHKEGSGMRRVTFVGHSFGGSIAIIACYDMLLKGLVRKQAGHNMIFTYAALKIGQEKLLHEDIFRNSPIYEINTTGDFFLDMPRCIYIPHFDIWRCYKTFPYLVVDFPMFTSYAVEYSPDIRELLVTSYPELVQNCQAYVQLPVITQQGMPNLVEAVEVKKEDKPAEAAPKRDEIVEDKGMKIEEIKKQAKHLMNDDDDKLFEGLNESIDDLEKTLNHHLKKPAAREREEADEEEEDEESDDLEDLKDTTDSDISLHDEGDSMGGADDDDHMDNRRRRRMMFLEKSERAHTKNKARSRSRARTQTRAKQINYGVYTGCTNRGNLVECHFSQRKHTMFFGIDIESCE